MIIKKIRLKDFRQYKGEQEIEFSTDKEKNVTVILGINTSGKTTLIEAFKWCLYDKTTYNKSELINVEAAKELGMGQEREVYVEVTLEHDNKEYNILRSRKYRKQNNYQTSLGIGELHVSYKEQAGETVSIRDIERQDTINSILPEDLADYFFFDGERIGDIGNRGDIKKAVQGLMGLEAITSAMNRLDPDRKSSVTSMFEKELDIGSNNKSLDLNKDIELAQDKLEKSKVNLEDKKDALEIYEKRKEELDLEISANSKMKDKQKERKILEREKVNIGNKIESSKNKFFNKFSSDSKDFFLYPLAEKSEKRLEDIKDDVEAIAGINARAIDEIIKRNLCICGRGLDEGALEAIERERQLLPPYHIGTEIRAIRKDYGLSMRSAEKFKKDLESYYRDYRDYLRDLEDIEKKIDRLVEELSKNKDVGKLEEERSRCIRSINEHRDSIEAINKRIGRLESDIKMMKSDKESLVKVTEKNKELQLYIDYSKALYREFLDSHLKKEKEVREDLEKNINEIFTEMYHGDRYVEIDDDYRVILGTKVGEDIIKTSESKGLEAVKNFSFISGLVQLAKEKVSDNELKTEPYPLVMDAPFSNVDEIHIKNIANILPEVAEQVILILMEKDWKHARESMEHRVGNIYTIEKINNLETHSEVKGR